MWYELHIFQKKLDTLKMFLSELASRENEIVTFGLKHVADWKSYEEAKPIIDEFEVDLLEVEELSKYIDREISGQLTRLKNESKIIEEIVTISVQLAILTNKKRPSVRRDVARSILLQIPYISGIFRNQQFFSKEQISIQKILVSLSRLSSLAKRLEKISRKISNLDDEIFKPSKIDNNLLLERLDNAIESLKTTDVIASQDKERLIEYITAAKAEVAGEKPNWNKAVGALVIVATLLGGVAVAPQAYDNVAKAIQHILGVSIEKHIPNMLPTQPKEDGNDPSSRKHTAENSQHLVGQ